MLPGATRFGRCPVVPGLLFGVVTWCVYAICCVRGLLPRRHPGGPALEKWQRRIVKPLTLG